jgi:predicted PurR-regulated permease PerM
MADVDRQTEEVQQAQSPSEMPLPSEPQVIFLGGLFILAVLAAAYVARDIVLPLAFAITLKLLLQPLMRLLEQARLPKTIAALLIILALLGVIVGLGAAISGPASAWAAKLPEGIPRIQARSLSLR